MSRSVTDFLFLSCPLEEEMRVRLSGLSVHKLDRTTVATNLETTLHESCCRSTNAQEGTGMWGVSTLTRGAARWHPEEELWSVKSPVGASVKPQLCWPLKPLWARTWEADWTLLSPPTDLVWCKGTCIPLTWTWTSQSCAYFNVGRKWIYNLSICPVTFCSDSWLFWNLTL